MTVNIRPWTQDDLPAIRDLLQETWMASYVSIIPETDLRSYLDAQYSIERLCSIYNDPHVAGHVAEADGIVAGYVKLFFAVEERRLYVHQLYIRPLYQNAGLGKRLMLRAANRASDLGFDQVWLGVMVQNIQAVDWYRAMGFVVTETAPFVMGGTTVDHHIGYVPVKQIFKVPRKKLFSPKANGQLADQMGSLLDAQRGSWKMLADGMDSLTTSEIKQLDGDGFRAFLQWNPKRIVSTGAKVDAKTIAARRCFLCVENLPDAQQGILYREDFLILCNPAPIFRQHFTIPHIRHTLQLLEPHLGVMLVLARDLSQSLSVFYNGPRCGASAPDHMHFQASPFRGIPVERDVDLTQLATLQYAVDNVKIDVPQSYGRELLVLRSKDAESLERVFRRLMSAMREAMHSAEEPLVNVICSHFEGMWRIIVFLRRTHRPEAYFREGDDKILISPAAVDIGGLVVTPHEHDYKRVDAALLQEIFREVSLDRSDTLRILEILFSSSP